MSALKNNKINTLARVLREDDRVRFKYNSLFYEVFKSAECGYVVNVYSNDERDDEDSYLQKHNVDGGLCTGSAREAIAFML